jgi:DNA-binding transcriptional LysR family regulator
MDRLHAMRLFTRIVELGSFTAAADDQGIPRATATHTLQQMEKRLGVRLLHRTTRHVSATLDGQAHYQRCVRLLADVEEAESAFREAAPKGRLKVDLQRSLAERAVLPRLPEFFERYPELELEIGLGDRLVDLVREGVDCVLRAGEPRESTMVARRIALKEQVTCASADYLDRHGTPRTLEALRGHRAVNYFSPTTGKAAPFEFRVGGTLRTMTLKGLVAVNDANAYVRCCEEGLGLIQCPRYHVEDALHDGRLREVLKRWRPPPMPVSVMYPHARQLSPRVRVFVDWLAECFAEPPAARR